MTTADSLVILGAVIVLACLYVEFRHWGTPSTRKRLGEIGKRLDALAERPTIIASPISPARLQDIESRLDILSADSIEFGRELTKFRTAQLVSCQPAPKKKVAKKVAVKKAAPVKKTTPVKKVAKR